MLRKSGSWNCVDIGRGYLGCLNVPFEPYIESHKSELIGKITHVLALFRDVVGGGRGFGLYSQSLFETFAYTLHRNPQSPLKLIFVVYLIFSIYGVISSRYLNPF